MLLLQNCSQHIISVVISIIKCELNLHIYSLTSTVQPLKFHPIINWACDHLSILGLKLICVSGRLQCIQKSTIIVLMKNNCFRSSAIFMPSPVHSFRHGHSCPDGEYRPGRVVSTSCTWHNIQYYCETVDRRMTNHNDVIKWKRFPRYWPFVRGIHRSQVNSPHKSQWRVALMFSFICAWNDGWVNNREAGDSRLHRAHYEVMVMITVYDNAGWFYKSSRGYLID